MPLVFPKNRISTRKTNCNKGEFLQREVANAKLNNPVAIAVIIIIVLLEGK
jgi:hypothetical protein